MPTNTTDARFAADVLESEAPVVVFFYATWAGPCRLVSPILAELEVQYPDARFVQIDIDANPETPRTYEVLTVPTIIVFRAGEAVRTIVGAKPKAALVQDLDPYL